MSLRRRLRTVPLVWWVAAILLASVTAGTTTRALRDARAAIQRWGAVVPVVVVVEPVAAGAAVDGDSVATRHVPRWLVPDGAVSEPPGGRRALVDLVPGEIVIASRLSGAGRTGLGAMIDDQEHAITVPSVTGDHPPVQPGDRMVLIAVPADGAPAAVLGPARVLALDPETGSVTVAVSRSAVVAVATAIERGRVVLTLVT